MHSKRVQVQLLFVIKHDEIEFPRNDKRRSWNLHPPHLIPCTQTETKDYIPYKGHSSIYILEKVEGKGEIKKFVT